MHIVCIVVLVVCIGNVFGLDVVFDPEIGTLGKKVYVKVIDPPMTEYKVEFMFTEVYVAGGVQDLEFEIGKDWPVGDYVLRIYVPMKSIVRDKAVLKKLDKYGMSWYFVYSKAYRVLNEVDVSLKWIISRAKLVWANQLSGIFYYLGKPPAGKYYYVIGGDEQYVLYDVECFKEVVTRLWLMEEYGYFKNKVREIRKDKLEVEYGAEDLALFAHTAIRLAMPNSVVMIAFAEPWWTNGMPHAIILFYDIDERLWVYDPVFSKGEVWPYDPVWGNMNISVLYLN